MCRVCLYLNSIWYSEMIYIHLQNIIFYEWLPELLRESMPEYTGKAFSRKVYLTNSDM